MSRYTLDFKLKVVHEYLEGETSFHFLKKKYNIASKRVIDVWVNSFKMYGVEGLKHKTNKVNYDRDFKVSVIQYRQLHRLTLMETANHFKIPNPALISTWERKFRLEGSEGLSRSRGRPSMKTNNEKVVLPVSETEREELKRLRYENELLRATLEYEKKLYALVQERVQKTKKRVK